MSAILHHLPARPRAAGAPRADGSCRAGCARGPEDYRRVLTRLMAAGVTGGGAIAAALNAERIRTPRGTAWDAAAVERLLGFLRHGGRAPLAPRLP